jgi:hypothetical protein
MPWSFARAVDENVTDKVVKLNANANTGGEAETTTTSGEGRGRMGGIVAGKNNGGDG